VNRCTQGWALANRVTADKAQVQSLGAFLTKLDPARAPRRFAQAQGDLNKAKVGVAEGKRWLAEHDNNCPICGVN
jgi:hypothetical protein